jgi:hypothetical protein
MQLVNFIEKIKNIFIWYHHKKTLQAYMIFLAIFGVIIFIPVRVMFLVLLIKKLSSGKKYK